MGFWIFMLICNLLVPLSMIGFGHCFIKSAPKEINGIFGYRTVMSMKNKETWAFAHQYCGKLWYNIGRIILPATILSMLFVIGKDVDRIGCLSLALIAVQLVCFIGSIFPTERALKKNFDENGIGRK